MLNKKIKACALHVAPVYMDKVASLRKVVNLISQAAVESVELLAFPEVFVPGFPYFTNCYAPNAAAVALYAAQSVVVPDDLTEVQAACAKSGIVVVLGISERMRGGHTIFNSIVTIDSDGTILGVHRKLQPTWAERLVWGQGSGYTLKTYEPKGAGYRIGGLACWEHTMNGARQALIDQGQHIHVGCWPALDILDGFENVACKQIEALMKTHALTAQVFVLCPSSYVDATCLEWMEKNLGPQDKVKPGGGWTAIIHPFCTFVAGPYMSDFDLLVVGEVDLSQLDLVKAYVDGAGHYKRPEVFKLDVDMTQRWKDEPDIVGPIPLNKP
ncbi:carbon-nitrogen hydrolase [Annulohypoxylon truncatum]|uniref:carbon-nitrogen hydrolase n=1 Tax=Annulohypoxylon truncatum TaxID=327061 RepID=UPI002008BE20|nr:carbon-nitrogen hydrolase [Annulohypoxylon truncatum]KAI1208292.1 carbon-nitrogen hydrolase [Annulohypoxylon truncatum]